jgi:hypothetical protein
MKIRVTLLLLLFAVIAFAENVNIVNPTSKPVTMQVVGFQAAATPTPTATPTASGLADGDPVSTWTDSSINGNNATMTGSNRPTFKTNIVNGKPVVRFTSAGLSKLTLATSISGASPWCMFAVMKQATAAGSVMALGGASGSDELWGLLAANDSTVYLRDRLGYNNGTNPVPATFQVLTGLSSGGSKTVWINGTSISLSGAALANSLDFTVIGYRAITSPLYGDGDIAEIIIYNASLSSTDRANIEKYLGTKYGITVAGGTAVQPDTVSGLVGWWKADSLGP